MFVDTTGKKRLKIGLHTHTTVSDGKKTPEEVAAMYAAAGYDMLAITDHWAYGGPGEVDGMKILSGCEYNMSGIDPETGVKAEFHIVGFGMERKPDLSRDLFLKDREGGPNIFERIRTVVKEIRQAGGVAVLAHPAWSLNTPAQIVAAGDFDALEIYNSVSECHMSDRPYSGLLVDMLGAMGVDYPLLATDDAHYYDGDEMRGMVMVEADAVEELGLAGAIRAGRFYATQGPEVHLERIGEDEVRVTCSPAVKVAFLSSVPWTKGRMTRGENITEVVYTVMRDRNEQFVRAEVTDANGLAAWSNILRV